MLKLTTDKHEASRGLSATAELLVFDRQMAGLYRVMWLPKGRPWNSDRISVQADYNKTFFNT